MSAAAEAGPVELVWSVVEQDWDGEMRLVVLPRDCFEHWLERLPVLECETWGELRATVSEEVYREVCGLCGYGTLAEYVAHLEITGVAPLTGGLAHAAAKYDPETTPPGDDEPFERGQRIPAHGDGDWPPAVAYLMVEELPEEILEEYATCYMTVLNGLYAEIPTEHKEDVLRDLGAMGYRLVEEPRLPKLVHARF